MELIQPKIYVTDFEVEKCLEYAERLDQISQMYGPEQPIVLHIESPGGDLVGLFILLDAINALPNPIYTYTTGMACSAGFMLLVTGNRNGGQRVVGENTHLMVHGIQMGFGEGYSDLKEVEERVRSAKVMNEQFLLPIAKSLGLENTKAFEELVRTKTKSHDLNLTAQEARELGMVDIIGALKLIPPSPTFGLMILDTDIEGHRKNCDNPDCECKINEEEPDLVERELEKFNGSFEEEKPKKKVKKKKK